MHINIWKCLILATVLIFLSSCDSSDTSNTDSNFDPASITPILETASAVSVNLDDAGGSITATGSNGIKYTLRVPAESLPSPITITLTPVADIPDLIFSDGMLAAAHFAPDGLELYPAATLEIELPPGIDTAGIVAFDYEGNGENLSFTLASRSGDIIRIPVSHFSGAGTGRTVKDISGLDVLLNKGSNLDLIMKFTDVANMTTEEFAQYAVEMYFAEFGDLAKIFEDKGSAAEVSLLIGYGHWKQVFFQESGFDVLEMLQYKPLADVLVDGDRLAALFLRMHIDAANADCIARESLADAERVLALQAIASWIGVNTINEKLDRATVLNNLCAQIAFEETNFPLQPIGGSLNSLSAKVGVSFGGGPARHENPIKVNLEVIPGTAQQNVLKTDVEGNVSTGVIPDSNAVRIDMKACLNANFNRLDKYLCQDAFIIRGLVISPPSAEVAPGGSVSFTAQVGDSSSDVTWSASGGTINDSGVFVAGTQEGEFTITATSVDNPSLTATATVVISTFDFTLFHQAPSSGYLIDENGDNICNSAPEGYKNSCVRLSFHFNSPDFVYVEGCIVAFSNGNCSGKISEWSFGAIVGNIFTADRHRTITFGTTVRTSNDPCPVRLVLSGTEGALTLSGQLKNFLANTCGPDSTTSFTLQGFQSQ
jgi:hypothetical protein